MFKLNHLNHFNKLHFNKDQVIQTQYKHEWEGGESPTSWLSETPETASTKALPNPVELSIHATFRTNSTVPRIAVK